MAEEISTWPPYRAGNSAVSLQPNWEALHSQGVVKHTKKALPQHWDVIDPRPNVAPFHLKMLKARLKRIGYLNYIPEHSSIYTAIQKKCGPQSVKCTISGIESKTNKNSK